MAKNKDINISPSKGISIVIKNDIVQPLPPIKPKKKECIDVLMYYQKHQHHKLCIQQVTQVILKINQGDFLYGVILLQLHQY